MLPVEFSKMQCLFTGNRFSGLSIQKTRYDFDPQLSKKNKGITLTLVLTVELDYLEIEDKVKYLQHATFEIADDVFTSGNTLHFIKDLVTEVQKELNRRYTSSNIFKFLELKEGADKMTDKQLTERLSRIISDYKNGKI